MFFTRRKIKRLAINSLVKNFVDPMIDKICDKEIASFLKEELFTDGREKIASIIEKEAKKKSKNKVSEEKINPNEILHDLKNSLEALVSL